MIESLLRRSGTSIRLTVYVRDPTHDRRPDKCFELDRGGSRILDVHEESMIVLGSSSLVQMRSADTAMMQTPYERR